MNEIGWFVAGIEFVVIAVSWMVIRGAYMLAVKQDKKISEAAARIERDGREIEELRRQIRGWEGLEENVEKLYAAATDEKDPKFFDVVRLIKKHRQDSEELTAAKERAGKIFITEPGV